MRMKTYDAIFVDVFNYIYRKKSTAKAKDSIRTVVSGLTEDVQSRLKKDGELYLLFDPIAKSDLGLSKTFTYTGFRKKILSDYKMNRIVDPKVAAIASIVLKYFMYRGEKVKIFHHPDYEADDYVDPLIEQLSKKEKCSIALLTNDLDYARYLQKGPISIELINDIWDNPYTTKEFKNTFQFEPHETANTFYKAIFGDKSDNITGAISVKKAKFNVPIKMIALKFIQYLSKNKPTIEQVVDRWKNTKIDMNKRDEWTPLEELYFYFQSVDMKAPVTETMFNNIKVICTPLKGKDITNLIQWKPIDKSFNDVIHDSIFGIKFSTQFGKV